MFQETKPEKCSSRMKTINPQIQAAQQTLSIRNVMRNIKLLKISKKRKSKESQRKIDTLGTEEQR